MSDKNIAICVVGCGNWGRNHILTLHEFGILGGIVDSNEENLKNLKITRSTQKITRFPRIVKIVVLA